MTRDNKKYSIGMLILVVLLIISIATSGCSLFQSDQEDVMPTEDKSPQDIQASPEPLENTPDSQETGQQQESGIVGKTIHASDVQSQPDTPLKEAIVVAIRSDLFPSLIDKAGMTIGSGQLGFLRFQISKEDFLEFVQDSSISAWNGKYELFIPPGDYTVCLGNVGTSVKPESFPIGVWGCVEVSVPEGKQIKMDILQSRGVGTKQ